MFNKILKKFFPQPEKGQGLVEYALILVLVAVVVIAILLTLGPAVAQVYCRITNSLQPGSCVTSGVIVSVTTFTTGGARRVSVTVSELTDVTVNVTSGGSGASLATPPGPCSSVTTCTYNIPNESSPGSATVTASAGGTATVTW